MSQNNLASKTSQIYIRIIDKLITEIKEDVTNEGCNEDILKELKSVRKKILNI